MNILFVTREYPPFEVGGVAKHTFYLVKHLRRLGASCRVLSFGDPRYSGEGVVFVEPSSSIISRSNRPLLDDVKIPLDIYRLTRAARGLIGEGGFDLVHVEEPYVGAFVTHERKVTTVHDTSYGELKSILHYSVNIPNMKRALFYALMGFWLEFICVASSKLVVTPYQHVKEELMKVYRVDERMIRVINNGLELPEPSGDGCKAEAKQELGLDDEKLMIFTSGQHVARKRLDLLVEAINLLSLNGVGGFQVVIGGDGPLRHEVLGLVGKYGLGDVIHLPGWVSEEQLARYYRAADIFVLASEYEAGPLSLLEAMASGAAVVSSDIDGFPRLIRNGVDGLLFPVGDVRSLSNCLRQLLKDSHLRSRMSSSARLFAERFDWTKAAEETLNLYEGLL